MKKTKNSLPEGVTTEMLTKWKQSYGENSMKLAKLESSSKTITVVFNVPTRHTRGQFERYIDKDPVKAREILIKNCLRTSVDEVMADDELFESAVTAIVEYFPIGKAETEDL